MYSKIKSKGQFKRKYLTGRYYFDLFNLLNKMVILSRLTPLMIILFICTCSVCQATSGRVSQTFLQLFASQCTLGTASLDTGIMSLTNKNMCKMSRTVIKWRFIEVDWYRYTAWYAALTSLCLKLCDWLISGYHIIQRWRIVKMFCLTCAKVTHLTLSCHPPSFSLFSLLMIQCRPVAFRWGLQSCTL